ncbi:unnamed protein product, partial [Staurois parvus]
MRRSGDPDRMDGWMDEQMQGQTSRVGSRGVGAVQAAGRENSRVTRQVSNSQASQGSEQESTAQSGTIRVRNIQNSGIHRIRN